MRRPLLASLLALATAVPVVGLAAPGPNGSNNHGLCNAYFRGSETGRANKRKAGPFAELERVSAEAYDAEHGENEASIEDKVTWWCGQNAPHPSGNGSAAKSSGGGKAGSDKASGKKAR